MSHYKIPNSGKGASESNSTEPQILEMSQLLNYLEEKGKLAFGKHFQICREDEEVLFKLMVYLFKDKQNADKYKLDLRKGLMLNGPVGCGKTSLMLLFRQLAYPGFKFQVVSAREVCIEFMEQGHQVLKYYASIGQKHPIVFCFDDLGTETSMKYYGNDVNVMAEILLSRYDLFVQKRIPTHITTNLSASELEALYGNRVRSRMREMFNLIAFPQAAGDKRG